jgi:hypothetical protein
METSKAGFARYVAVVQVTSFGPKDEHGAHLEITAAFYGMVIGVLRIEDSMKKTASRSRRVRACRITKTKEGKR